MRYSLPVLILFAYRATIAQDQPHFFIPVVGDGQKLREVVAANDGAIGMDARKVAGGFKVAKVAPAGPAEKSGIRVDDVITAIDGNSVARIAQAEFYRLLAKKPGDTIQVSYMRNGHQGQLAVAVDSRGQVADIAGGLISIPLMNNMFGASLQGAEYVNPNPGVQMPVFGTNSPNQMSPLQMLQYASPNSYSDSSPQHLPPPFVGPGR